jgi:GntR family transcriptional regulator
MSPTDGHRPAAREIAAELREQIRRGALAPGQALPTEAQLTDRYGVNRTTVRRALDELRAEGRIVSYQGRGSFVREAARLRRLQAELTRRAPRRGWYAALDREGRPPAVRTSVSWGEVPGTLREWIEPGARVLVRARVMGIEGEPPIQLAASHIPADVAERVPALQSLDTGPGGMLSRLEDAGYGPLRFDEIVSARMPAPEEADALGLGPGMPVLLVYRVTYAADGRVLDAMERIIAADRCEVAYSWPPLAEEEPADA